MSARPRGYGVADILHGVRELAAYLGCQEASARAWADERGIGIKGLGRATLYPVSDVLEALRRGRVPAEPPAPRRSVTGTADRHNPATVACLSMFGLVHSVHASALNTALHRC